MLMNYLKEEESYYWSLSLKEVFILSKFCAVCGKGPRSANIVSHSHLKTKRRQMPNLQKKKIKLDGKYKSIYVCTRCLRSKKVETAA